MKQKAEYLKRYKHPQWGSILGSEKEIRLAVLKDEIMRWHDRVENGTDDIPNWEHTKDLLLGRIEELIEELEDESNV